MREEGRVGSTKAEMQGTGYWGLEAMADLEILSVSSPMKFT